MKRNPESQVDQKDGTTAGGLRRKSALGFMVILNGKRLVKCPRFLSGSLFHIIQITEGFIASLYRASNYCYWRSIFQSPTYMTKQQVEWEAKKSDMMKCSKFNQNPELKAKLSATGSTPLYECTQSRFWGTG